MIGIISWIIAGFSAYGAITGYNITNQESNTASVILLGTIALIFFIIGLVSFVSKSGSSGSYGGSSSDGGFFSDFGGGDSGGGDGGGGGD